MSRGGFYRTEDGQGSMHLNTGRRDPPLRCRAARLATDNPQIGDSCGRMAAKLCDSPAGVDLQGKPLTCDMPICAQHATYAGPNRDYCPRHAHLATQCPTCTGVPDGAFHGRPCPTCGRAKRGALIHDEDVPA